MLPTVKASTAVNLDQPPRLVAAGNTWPFIVVTVIFFIFGVPALTNPILIKQFMKSFELTPFEAGLIQSAYFMGYFVWSVPAGLLMRKVGYKNGLVIGLFLYSAGTFLFWPAALVQRYECFLFALFVIAGGASFLETGANLFITLMGDPRSAERRLNLSQAFNPLGSVMGVLVGTVFIFSGVELSHEQVAAKKLAGTYAAYLRGETLRVVNPYLILGAAVFLWALVLMNTRLPKVGEEAEPADTRSRGNARDLIRYPHFVKAVVAQFLYLAASVGTLSYLIPYTQDYTHQSEKIAGYFLTGTLLGFGAGRFASTYLMKFIEPARLMGIFALINTVLMGLGILFPGWVGLVSLTLSSLFFSLMFPTTFALGIRELGANTKLGGSILIMSIVGGACGPPVMGLIFKATHSMAVSMVMPLLCYVFVAYYAFYGSRIRTPALVVVDA